MAAGHRLILLVLTMVGFAAPAAASFDPLSNIRTRNDASPGQAAVRLKKTGTGAVQADIKHVVTAIARAVQPA